MALDRDPNALSSFSGRRWLGLVIYLLLFGGIGVLIWHAIDERTDVAALIGFASALLTALGALVLPPPNGRIDSGVGALITSIGDGWKSICDSIKNAADTIGTGLAIGI